MKTYVIIIVALSFFNIGGLAQIMTVPGGGQVGDSVYQLSWTIGEPISGTTSNGKYTLTIGFFQPKLTVTSVKSINENLFLKAYPNPTSDFVFVSIKGMELVNITAELYSLEGRQLQLMDLSTHLSRVDFTGLPVGTYILKVKQKEQVLRLFKVIKTY